MWFDWKRCLIYKRSFNCRSNYFSVVFGMFFSVPLFLRQNLAKLMRFEHVRASACDTLQNHLVTFFSFIRNFLLVHLSHSLVTLIDPICWCSRDSCSFFISVLLCTYTQTLGSRYNSLLERIPILDFGNFVVSNRLFVMQQRQHHYRYEINFDSLLCLPFAISVCTSASAGVDTLEYQHIYIYFASCG